MKRTQSVTPILHIRDDTISSNDFAVLFAYCVAIGLLLTLGLINQSYYHLVVFDCWNAAVKSLFIGYLCCRFLTRNMRCLIIYMYQCSCFSHPYSYHMLPEFVNKVCFLLYCFV